MPRILSQIRSVGAVVDLQPAPGRLGYEPAHAPPKSSAACGVWGVGVRPCREARLQKKCWLANATIDVARRAQWTKYQNRVEPPRLVFIVIRPAILALTHF